MEENSTRSAPALYGCEGLYGRTTTAMHDLSTSPLHPPFSPLLTPHVFGGIDLEGGTFMDSCGGEQVRSLDDGPAGEDVPGKVVYLFACASARTVAGRRQEF